MDEPLEKLGVTTISSTTISSKTIGSKNKRWERGMNAVAPAGMEYSET